MLRRDRAPGPLWPTSIEFGKRSRRRDLTRLGVLLVALTSVAYAAFLSGAVSTLANDHSDEPSDYQLIEASTTIRPSILIYPPGEAPPSSQRATATVVVAAQAPASTSTPEATAQPTETPRQTPTATPTSEPNKVKEALPTPAVPGITEASIAALGVARNPTPEAPVYKPTPSTSNQSDCTASGSPLYCIYTVKAGETMSAIAYKFGFVGKGDLSPWKMLAESNKPDITSEDMIRVGDRLRIPTTNGLIHTIHTEQTMAEIADIYGVEVSTIKSLSVNQRVNFDSLAIGTEMIIPDPVRLPVPPPPPAPPPEPDVPAPTPTPVPLPTVVGGPVSSSGFIWPLIGPLSSYFGPNHPLGVDIDLQRRSGVGIGAAAPGKVTFAGGNPCCSYGYYVIVDHGNGFVTLYAHFSSIAVRVGESVYQGQRLGIGGSTGRSTGPHLHFEMKRNGVTVNPLNYLPSRYLGY